LASTPENIRKAVFYFSLQPNTAVEHAAQIVEQGVQAVVIGDSMKRREILAQ
jgi:hypothetical protein